MQCPSGSMMFTSKASGIEIGSLNRPSSNDMNPRCTTSVQDESNNWIIIGNNNTKVWTILELLKVINKLNYYHMV